MDRKVPPIINCRTISQKDNHALVWLHPGIEGIPVHPCIATSLSDYLSWKRKADITALVLTEVSGADFEELKKHKISLFVTKAAFKQFPRADWIALQVSIGILEELSEHFPIVSKPWDGTLVDAVCCVTLMLHFNHLVLRPGEVLSAERSAQFASYSIRISDAYTQPPQIWLITQYFVHSVTKRQKEIRQCLKNNLANPLINKVVLLNEEDLRYEWSSSKYADKVQQEIIRKRLTYADLLKYTYEKVPPNTIVIYANADIFCNNTLKHVHTVNMTDKLFALLRYDEQEDESLRLFGPRPDSQDTWICLSDSVKSRTWDFKAFDYKLGTAGCDNRFTGDMFGMRFLISNPCQTIQTIHVHQTAIRNYNPKDIVPAKLYMYIHPCSIVELQQQSVGDEKVCALAPRSTAVTIKGLNAKKLQTYCVMLARENRFKWSEVTPTVMAAKPLQIYHWKDAFVTNCGVVYDYKNVWLGSVETGNAFAEKVGRDLGIAFVQAAEKQPAMLAIPCTTLPRYMHVDLYCLYYLSYALQIYQHLPADQPTPSLYLYPPSIPTLQSFAIRSGHMPAVQWNPTVCAYAKDVYGYIPETCEVSSAEIDALRSAFPLWQPTCTTKCVVLVDEFLVPEFVEESIAPLLPSGWRVEQVLRTSSGVEAYRQIIGAGLCILFNLPKQEEQWAKLWTLPQGCPVLEFQNELKVEGGFQHLAAAASLDAYCIPLHKGTPIEMRQQLLTQFKQWLVEHPLMAAADPVPDVVSPTGIFLSL